MSTVEFTSHNILLPDGTETIPGMQRIADTGICQAALRDINRLVPFARTVADLGCLEGGYAVEFARSGYDVTGVEVNPDNLACCRYVAERAHLPRLNFVGDDVLSLIPDMAVKGWSWDVVFCCGLLYHLENPAGFLRQLAEVTNQMLILQTRWSLDETQQNEGYRGAWFEEHPGRWSSHGNRQSFWLGHNELLDAIRAAGFPVVFEQFDFMTSIRMGTYIDQHEVHTPARGMFVGIKP